MDENLAVSIHNGQKSYGRKVVLKDLCMNVSKGSIYGLLGPSGCGKTTVMSCLVGVKHLSSGHIWVLGGAPGTPSSLVPGPRVGYMPQEISLVQEFSVRGSVFYFGRICGMAENDIDKKFRELSQLLELPPDDRLVQHCSGGQQRRISLAAAIVNNPDLLILDEPTVGLDPVLRASTWNHLLHITKRYNTSVIITTHYIEEATSAHKLGLMREGTILVEDSPQNLLNQFQTDSLEKVFLVVSKQQSLGIRTNYNSNPELNNITASTPSINGPVNQNFESRDILLQEAKPNKKMERKMFSINKYRLKALLGKNWMQFKRNPGGTVAIICYSFIVLVAFFIAIGDDPKDLKLGVVNDEEYREQCSNISKITTVTSYNDSYCDMKLLGCRLLDGIADPMIKMEHFNNLDDAIMAIKHGKLVGAIFIPKNFSVSLQEKLLDGGLIDDETISLGQVQAYLDLSNRMVGSALKYKLMKKVIDFAKQILIDCNYPPKFGDFPVRFEEPVYGSKDEIFQSFMFPGMILTVIFFMGTASTAMVIITDRVEGVWHRSLVNGVSSFEIVMAHFLTQFILVMLQITAMLIVSFLIFKTECKGSPIFLIIILLLEGLVGMSYGMWVSIVAKNVSEAILMTVGTIFMGYSLSGVLWPLEGMTATLRYVSYAIPFCLPAVSLRNILHKGWSFMHLGVLHGVGVNVFWVIFFAVISAYQLKRSK